MQTIIEGIANIPRILFSYISLLQKTRICILTLYLHFVVHTALKGPLKLNYVSDYYC